MKLEKPYQKLQSRAVRHPMGMRCRSMDRDFQRSSLLRFNLPKKGMQQRVLLRLVSTLTSIFRLSKTRRKRAVPEDWTTSDTIQSFAPLNKSKSMYPGARTVSMDASGDLALLGGADGSAGIFSISQNKLVQEVSAGSAVTDTLWAGNKAIVGTSAGTIKVFDNGTESASFSGHAGEVNGLALHASGEILASVGVDKSYILYDLTASTQVLQIYTDSGKPI